MTAVRWSIFFLQKPPAKNKKKRRPKSRVDVVENENCSGSEGDARGKDVKETVVSEPTSQMNRPAIRHAAKEAEASEVSEVDVNDEVESRRKAKKGKLKTKDSEKRSNEGVKDEQGAVNDCPEGRRRKARKVIHGGLLLFLPSSWFSLCSVLRTFCVNWTADQTC